MKFRTHVVGCSFGLGMSWLSACSSQGSPATDPEVAGGGQAATAGDGAGVSTSAGSSNSGSTSGSGGAAGSAGTNAGGGAGGLGQGGVNVGDASAAGTSAAGASAGAANTGGSNAGSAGTAGAAGSGNPNEVDVYLIAGQSNATGQGYTKNIPATFKIDGRVQLYHSPEIISGAAANTWIPLRHASEAADSCGDRFGPELGFGTNIRTFYPERSIALIKHAKSATNLVSQWAPGSSAADFSQFGPEFKTSSRRSTAV